MYGMENVKYIVTTFVHLLYIHCIIHMTVETSRKGFFETKYTPSENFI